jgi:hypothetical protein
MPYIGKQPLTGAYQLCDTITTSATATYNLLVGGSGVIPGSAQNCIVSLNGVIQAPVGAFTVSGSTITFASTLSATDVIDFILILGNVFDIGTPTNGTVTPSSIQGGTSGLFTWQSVQTTGFTAVAGRAYPCNTTSASFTVTLPATPSIGQQVLLLDYAGTADTNAIVINPNGNKIEGATSNLQLSGEREGVTLTYIDSTQGWLASSGINEGTDALAPVPYSASYLIVAGGGGAGANNGGAGGAGGLLSSTTTINPGTVYTCTVGAGGAGVIYTPRPPNTGGNGTNSSITGLTAAVGGGGGGQAENSGSSGGSGGSGGNGPTSAGSGTVGQGNAGGTSGDSGPYYPTGGGGGAGAVGGNFSGGSTAGAGGSGSTNSLITTTQATTNSVGQVSGGSVYFAGGGGGTVLTGGAIGSGGLGGGGAGVAGSPSPGSGGTGVSGTANTGGGGGGAGGYGTGGSGGSGVVILSVPTANYTGTTTGSPTVVTNGSNTVIIFKSTGTYTG